MNKMYLAVNIQRRNSGAPNTIVNWKENSYTKEADFQCMLPTEQAVRTAIVQILAHSTRDFDVVPVIINSYNNGTLEYSVDMERVAGV